MEYANNWKNSSVFIKQLQLNETQLNGEYPEHWMSFIQFINRHKFNSILDVGCGCGSYYALCKKEFPWLTYTGIDYSEEAIRLAIETWDYSEFFVRDYIELTSEYVNKFDLIHMGALLDVLSNGDEALQFILSLRPKNVLIGRMNITDDESHFNVYTAYDEIITYSYHHNKNNFFDLCKKYHYIVENINNNFYLKRYA